MAAVVTVRVDNRIRIGFEDLPGKGTSKCPLMRELTEPFEHENPDFEKHRRMKLRSRPPPERISTWSMNKEELTFPRGAWSTIREVLRSHGLGWDLVDDRCEAADPEPLKLRVEPFPFQRRLVRVAKQRENCLWRSPPGSGKTTAALLFAAEVGVPTLVLVSTVVLQDQWVRRIRKQLDLEPGIIRGKKWDQAQIVVGSVKTVARDPGLIRGRYGALVCDEVQLFAAETLRAVADVSDARYRLGVSADERRADGKEFLIHEAFGEVAAEVSERELIDQGFLHDVEVRVIPTAFDAPWWRQLSKSRNVYRRKVEAFGTLLEQMTENQDRNALALQAARWSVRDRGQVLLLSNRREHCEALARMCRSDGMRTGLLIGSTSAAEKRDFELGINDLERGIMQAAAGTYQAVGYGFDVPILGRGVCTTPVANDPKGRMQFRQFCGRIARRNRETDAAGKKDAILYYLWDRVLFGPRPLQNLVRWNNQVLVLDGDQWVNGREYLKEVKRAKAERDEEAEDDVLGIGG